MRASNERLTILSEAEQAALYELPNFDDEQRLNYLNLTPEEQTLMHARATLAAKIHCALQIGYFKAVHIIYLFLKQTKFYASMCFFVHMVSSYDK